MRSLLAVSQECNPDLPAISWRRTVPRPASSSSSAAVHSRPAKNTRQMCQNLAKYPSNFPKFQPEFSLVPPALTQVLSALGKSTKVTQPVRTRTFDSSLGEFGHLGHILAYLRDILDRAQVQRCRCKDCRWNLWNVAASF